MNKSDVHLSIPGCVIDQWSIQLELRPSSPTNPYESTIQEGIQLWGLHQSWGHPVPPSLVSALGETLVETLERMEENQPLG